MLREETSEAIVVWPALLILSEGRQGESSHALLERIVKCLSPLRWREDEHPSVDRMVAPASPEHVLGWLHSLWKRLSGTPRGRLMGMRRSIVKEIVDARLSAETQAGLLTAVDYLVRFHSAHTVSSTGRSNGREIIPLTRNPVMQAAYQRLVGLATTDLPIWLAGERGTELDRLASAIHRLRDLPQQNLHVLTPMDFLRNGLGTEAGILKDFFPYSEDSTIVAKDVQDVPEPVQRMLYRHLVTELARPRAFRIVVTSRPVDFADHSLQGMIPDLIAFLSPTRIAVPPLRERVEDIEGLIHFFSMSRGVQDPVERLAPEALESLRHYHWPRNTEELEMTVAFILHKRPSGLIRPEDLPSTIGGQTDHYLKLLDLLEEILVDEGFRRVAALEGRLRLARFLTEHAGEPFRASEIQNLFAIGRETARRLLKTLESHGLIRGIKGATQRRTTRYRLNSLP